jgi:tRNA U34 5-carboxymethylaminomethyl modifying GTPase MnmE/TrmE
LDTEQLEVLANYPGAMLAANKMDHAAQWDVHAHRACETVATTGAGVDELRRRISAHFGCQIVDIAQPRWWTVRQREILERAVASPQALREI